MSRIKCHPFSLCIQLKEYTDTYVYHIAWGSCPTSYPVGHLISWDRVSY